MRTIIAGSRYVTNRTYLDSALQSCPFTKEISVVLCGGANGVDLLGDQWAADANLPVHYYIVEDASAYPWGQLRNLVMIGGGYANAEVVADWVYDGPKAGPLRNARMAENADALIALLLEGAENKGTNSMIRAAMKRDLRIFSYVVKQNGGMH